MRKKNKLDLLEDIKILGETIKGLRKTIDIQAARLQLAYDALEKLGYTIEQINGMLKLPCEKKIVEDKL